MNESTIPTRLPLGFGDVCPLSSRELLSPPSSSSRAIMPRNVAKREKPEPLPHSTQPVRLCSHEAMVVSEQQSFPPAAARDGAESTTPTTSTPSASWLELPAPSVSLSTGSHDDAIVLLEARRTKDLLEQVLLHEERYLRLAVQREMHKRLHRDSIARRFRFTVEGIALLLMPERDLGIFDVRLNEYVDPASLEPYFGAQWYRRDFDVHEPSICPDPARCVRHCLSVMCASVRLSIREQDGLRALTLAGTIVHKRMRDL